MSNRILKESICTSDTLDTLSWFEEAFFYRLIVNCDDYGRMDARPAILKAKLFPLKERLTLQNIENALKALADAGCVKLYQCDSKPYLCLPTWGVHQQIRAKKSKYPAPENACNQMISDDSKCPRNPIQSESNPKVSGPKPRTVFQDDTKEMCLARLLFAKMRENNPGAKEPNWQNWAREFDLILRVDHREPEDVRDMIAFSQWHQFWRKNILSPGKLREKYDQLTLQRKECRERE